MMRIKRRLLLFLTGWLLVIPSLPTAQLPTAQAQGYPIITREAVDALVVVDVIDWEGDVPHLQFDAQNPMLLHAYGQGQDSRLNLSNHQREIVQVEDAVHVMSSPDGTLLAVSDTAHSVHVLQSDTREELTLLAGFETISDFLTFNANGSMLAATAPQDNIRLWQVQEGNTRQIVVPGGAPVRFSRDSFLLAFVDPDNANAVVVKNLAGVMNEQFETTLATLIGHRARITDIAFAPDSLTIATASADGTISLWGAVKGTEKTVLMGHRATVGRLGFSPDGLLLASASDDGTVRFWDVATGEALGTLKLANTPITELDWNVDGTLLAISGPALGAIHLVGLGEAVGVRTVAATSTPPPPQTYTVNTPLIGTMKFDTSAGSHPLTTTGCLIRAGDKIMVVAQADEGAWLVYSNSPTCEGLVWVRNARVDWGTMSDETLLATLDTLPVPHVVPLYRLPSSVRQCETASGTSTLTRRDVPYRVYPPDYLPTDIQPTLDTGVDIVICHDYVAVRIENCHYLGPGNYSYIYTRYRTDDHLRLVNFTDGTIIASRTFQGQTPPLCPAQTERGEVYGDPAPPENWVPWVVQLATGGDQVAIRTVVKNGNLNARELPDTTSSIVAQVAVGTPLTLLARNTEGDWVVVLLPDMHPAWVFTDLLTIANQSQLDTLPITTLSAAEVPITFIR